ncbi:MAG TPA: PAS domain-containing protein [Hypericibacter adhaerens]|jgi:hypothetical protein|uniref:PAS domain-containing protein n=1 Tax=Hypericibacter adhaerens TaxID=2602016 RepID=A0A5J6N103_9PROT|nr:PAS domain-containing protein [Hypericibacter adhaerens]QEX23688.1 hypothetical protein FRZ61_36270 [Hypericibacter adhaerens]HWA45622.1 PAS domain-containing protein [Hypericibacter adhaerens]
MADDPVSLRRKPKATGARLSTATAQMERLSFEETSSAMIRQLAAYWAELRGDKPLPLKKDFDPARVVNLLPYLIVAEYHLDPLRIRYRLVGTEQVRHVGEDYTGKWLHEVLWDPRYIEVWLVSVGEMIESHQPIFGRDFLLWADGKMKNYEWAIFPVSADGARVTHGIGIEDFSTMERQRGLFAPDR